MYFLKPFVPLADPTPLTPEERFSLADALDRRERTANRGRYICVFGGLLGSAVGASYTAWTNLPFPALVWPVLTPFALASLPFLCLRVIVNRFRKARDVLLKGGSPLLPEKMWKPIRQRRAEEALLAQINLRAATARRAHGLSMGPDLMTALTGNGPFENTESSHPYNAPPPAGTKVRHLSVC